LHLTTSEHLFDWGSDLNDRHSNGTIVIADDDRVTRSVLRLLLQEHQYAVVGEAADGEKAVEVCGQVHPDIAFIDIDMPKMDGHQAAEEIRKKMPHVMVIMITSSPTAVNVQKARDSGANGFVIKPFTAVKVIEAINGCLKK
jgi:DNA-binding NarL/FixJ family response regulator